MGFNSELILSAEMFYSERGVLRNLGGGGDKDTEQDFNFAKNYPLMEREGEC